MVFQSKSTSETIRIGKQIGSLLQSGNVIALMGELGAGKTHLIKGLAAGVGVKKSSHISSPSFTLIHEYEGTIPFYHIDLFRLRAEKEADELGLEDYFRGKGITAIEWADRIPALLPKERLSLHMCYMGKHTRSIEILGRGKRYEEIVNQIVSSLKLQIPPLNTNHET